MKHNIEALSAAAAITSSVFWFVACFVRAKYKPTVIDGWTQASIQENGNDFLRTAKLQTAWNAGAAFAAAVAAIAQASAMLISS